MSNIDTSAINVNYPEAKVNNDSNGFRENFGAIKTGLDVASSEITQLQSQGLVKAALSQFPVNNDMANTLISNATTLGFNHTVYDNGTISGVTTISVKNGDVQLAEIGGNVSLKLINWAPVGTYSEMQLDLILSNSLLANSTITFPSQVTSGLDTIENYNQTNGTITFPANTTVLSFILSSDNCGTNIEIRPVNRSRKGTQFSDRVIPNRYGSQGDKAGDIAVDENYLYVCTGSYDGGTAIWYRKELLAW